MNKIKKYVIGCLMLFFVQAGAQNTATSSGNWDSCSTWGTPTIGITKGNDASSAKSIGTGLTVTMDTNWNALSVDFGSNNGILDFNGTANVLDLNTAGGTAQTCVAPSGFNTTYCSIMQTQSPAGALVSGTSYTGTLTWPYTGGVAGIAYPAEILTVNGLTLTRTAGTLVNGSGSVSYSLSGIFTGTTGTGAKFNLTLFSKNAQVIFTKDRLRNSIYNAGGTSLAAYDAAANDTWVQITAAEYNSFTEGASTSYCGINQNDISGSNLGAGNGTSQGNTWCTSDYGAYNPNGIPVANYILYAMAWNNAGNNAAGTGVNPLYLGTGVSSGYISAVGPVLSTAASTGSISYFVRKKSTLNIGSRIFIAGYNTASLYLDCYTSTPGNINGFGLRPFATGNQAPNNSNACQGLQQLKLTAAAQW
jgi:hypothetical protein